MVTSTLIIPSESFSLHQVFDLILFNTSDFSVNDLAFHSLISICPSLNVNLILACFLLNNSFLNMPTSEGTNIMGTYTKRKNEEGR